MARGRGLRYYCIKEYNMSIGMALKNRYKSVCLYNNPLDLGLDNMRTQERKIRGNNAICGIFLLE